MSGVACCDECVYYVDIGDDAAGRCGLFGCTVNPNSPPCEFADCRRFVKEAEG